MIKVVPYDPAHLDIFEAKEDDITRYGELDKGITGILADDGVSFTAIADGRILLVGGIMPITKHTGYGWTIISRYATAYGRKIFYGVKNQLDNMMIDLRLHRVETANHADAFDHHRWCKLLGFREEGILWQYDDQGRDYIRFAKLMPLVKGG